MAARLNKSQREKLAAYEPFFKTIENKYRVTRDEIMQVIHEQGMVKSRIETYFLVRQHLQRRTAQ